jgi:hypothetical protein
MNIKIYKYEMYKPCIITEYNISNNYFNCVDLDLNKDIITVICFECLETISENIICKIKV